MFKTSEDRKQLVRAMFIGLTIAMSPGIVDAGRWDQYILVILVISIGLVLPDYLFKYWQRREIILKTYQKHLIRSVGIALAFGPAYGFLDLNLGNILIYLASILTGLTAVEILIALWQLKKGREKPEEAQITSGDEQP